MFWLIQKAFLALLSSSKSWANKSVSLNNESCMTKSTLIDLNHFGLNCYPFLISLEICDRICNDVDN